MKVLVVHESYQQPGGEDQSVNADIALLRSHGNDVIEYRRHNWDIGRYGAVRLGLTTVWSWSSYHELKELITEQRPDVVHVHNTLPLISPSGLWAAKQVGTTVIHTLRNYRLACPNALFYRNGDVCEDCLRWPVPLPGMVHGCYRASRSATTAIAAMLTLHRLIGTWQRAVDAFIVLTEFQKRKLIAAGLPERKLTVRPNFVAPDPGVGAGNGGYALFVGRLTREKGIITLLKAWQHLDMPIPLTIAGDGPLADEVRSAAATSAAITYLGPVPHGRTIGLMKGAAFLVFASEWYETFGRTIIEAWAVGLPVIAARRGAAKEIVDDGRTGVHFVPGDSYDLAKAVEHCLDRDAQSRLEMRHACRREYLEKYTADRAYQRLMAIYHAANGRTAGKTAGLPCG